MDVFCLLRIYCFTGNKHAFILILKTRYFYPLHADEETETHGSQGPYMSQGLYMRSHIYYIEKLGHETKSAQIENTYFIQTSSLNVNHLMTSL